MKKHVEDSRNKRKYIFLQGRMEGSFCLLILQILGFEILYSTFFLLMFCLLFVLF